MKLAQTNSQSSRRDSLKIARRFNAGIRLVDASSPAGTAEPSRQFRPSLRGLNPFAAQPGVKTPGYSHPSLRDKNPGARASARFTVRQTGSLEKSGASAIRALKRRERRAPVQINLRGSAEESQRDSGSKPKVARNELPWGNAPQPHNPNGVEANPGKGVATPLGLKTLPALPQGSSFLATLGWRTQSLRDRKTARREAARGRATLNGDAHA